VKGWTSRRLVSLPFSDHCAPLVGRANDLPGVLAWLTDETRDRWKSLELRPEGNGPNHLGAHEFGLEPASEYCLHKLDLRPGAPEIFRRFHPTNTQRAVRRAEREGLTYESGRSDRLLDRFYRLLRMTRRRHGLPPQPLAWFRNLIACLGDRMTIHLASKDDQPIASILTLSFKKTVFYKYGGSDAAHHRLGGMPFLFWRLIQGARTAGFAELDLGRSDLDQPGLIAFKDHLGATQSTLTYYRYPARHANPRRTDWMPRLARGVISHLPDAALDLAGRLLYKHLG
jgi:GNAT acetyltransferase-like protein